MRIKYDTFQPVRFAQGDLARQKSWDTLKRCSGNPGRNDDFDNTLHTTWVDPLKGNHEVADAKSIGKAKKEIKRGSQVIYLRADTNLNRYVSVELTNICMLRKETADPEKILFKLNLNEHDGIHSGIDS